MEEACSTHGEMINAYKILVAKRNGKGPLGITRHRWENCIVYSLLNNTLPVNSIVLCQIRGLYMNGELERMRNEAVVTKFKVIYRNFSGGREENHKNSVMIAGFRGEI
jgi:hypothetical protein